MSKASIEDRVVRAAEDALREHGYVAPVDVLVRIGWLQPVHRDHWRQGRVSYLERVVQAGLGKFSTAMRALRRWAEAQGLKPSETGYVARTRNRRTLRFSASGDPAIERACRTHWVSPALSEAKRARVVEQASRPPDLVVVAPLKDWTCAGCGGTGAFLLISPPVPWLLAGTRRRDRRPQRSTGQRAGRSQRCGSTPRRARARAGRVRLRPPPRHRLRRAAHDRCPARAGPPADPRRRGGRARALAHRLTAMATRRAPIFGPEAWAEVGGVTWSHWDRWSSAVCLAETDVDWSRLAELLAARSGRMHIRSDAEAKLSHLDDLADRLRAAGLGPADLAGAHAYWRDVSPELVAFDDYAHLHRAETLPWRRARKVDLPFTLHSLRDLAEEYVAARLPHHTDQARVAVAYAHVATASVNGDATITRELGSEHWMPIVALAESALRARRPDVAAAVFDAADQPGAHRDHLRRRRAALLGG